MPQELWDRAKRRQHIVQRLGRLKELLVQDAERARAVLRVVLGQITRRPTKDGLVTVLRANIVRILVW